MKKLTIITILFICVFVCISSSHAIPIIFKATGVGESYYEGCCDWNGLPFTLTATIDSGKKPFEITDDSTRYKMDSSVFAVNGIPGRGNWGTEAVLSMGTNFTKSGDYLSIRHIELECYGANECEFIEPLYGVHVGISFPLGHMGPHPAAIPTALESTEGKGSGYHWPGPDADDTLCKLTNVSIVSGPVPEPTTMLLLGAGLVGLAGFGRKRFKK